MAGADRARRHGFLHRHRGLVAVPAARAGARVARDLLRRPARVPRLPVAAEPARSTSATCSRGRSANYWDAISTYHEQLIRSFVYAGLATLHRARDQLPARVLDRVPRRALEEPLPARDHRAVLRHVPDPDARLADDPLRPRASSSNTLRTLGTCSARTAACSRPRRRSSRASPTTSCPSWRCRSTSRWSRSTRG